MEVKTSNIVTFVWKYYNKAVVKYLKIYGCGKISSTNCLKQIFSNQKYLILQQHFKLDNSNAFSKAILQKHQKSCKFEYLYSMFDDVEYCIDCAMFLSAKKQRSFGSFVNKGKKGSHNIPRKPEIKARESVSRRCYIGNSWNHREVLRTI